MLTKRSYIHTQWILYMILPMLCMRTEQMSHWLRAFVALAEEPGSVLTTHITFRNHVTTDPGDLKLSLFWQTWVASMGKTLNHVQ